MHSPDKRGNLEGLDEVHEHQWLNSRLEWADIFWYLGMLSDLQQQQEEMARQVHRQLLNVSRGWRKAGRGFGSRPLITSLPTKKPAVLSYFWNSSMTCLKESDFF